VAQPIRVDSMLGAAIPAGEQAPRVAQRQHEQMGRLRLLADPNMELTVVCRTTRVLNISLDDVTSHDLCLTYLVCLCLGGESIPTVVVQ